MGDEYSNGGPGGGGGNGRGTHDDEITVPGIPVPGRPTGAIGPAEPSREAEDESASDELVALCGITVGANKTAAAFGELAATCCPRGSPGRRRSLEILAFQAGEIGSEWHETRRDLLALIREEFPPIERKK